MNKKETVKEVETKKRKPGRPAGKKTIKTKPQEFTEIRLDDKAAKILNDVLEADWKNERRTKTYLTVLNTLFLFINAFFVAVAATAGFLTTWFLLN